MDRTHPIDTVKSIYAAFGRGDMAAILGHLDPEIEWEVFGPPHIDGMGLSRGHAGVLKFFEALANVEMLAYEPRNFLADGDTVVVLGRENGRYRDTGRSWKANWAQVFRFAAGRVVRYTEYIDSYAIALANDA
jgi:ketosteroid isomerase-like protein